MKYSASLDSLAKAITATMTLLFILVIVLLFIWKSEWYTILIFSIFILFIYFGMLLYRPLSYQITDSQLIIHRHFSDVKLDRNKIVGVVRVSNEQLAWSFRTFGVNGFFGYFGKFVNNRLGGMTWYATRRDNAILVTTSIGKKIILTPDEPEKFVSTFHKI